MYTIRKKFRFEAAHVLDSSYSTDCQEIHGHSYIIEVFCSSPVLNDDNMVVDFGKIKDELKPIIDAWDHSLIVSPQRGHDFPGYNVVVLEENPTAEYMARYLFRILRAKLPVVYKVRVHETESGYAEYCEDI